MGLEVRRGIILGRVRSVWKRFLGCCHDLFLNLGLTTQVCSFYENSSGSKLMCIFLYVCNTSKESLKEKKGNGVLIRPWSSAQYTARAQDEHVSMSVAVPYLTF